MTAKNGYALPVAFSALLHAVVLYVTFAGWSATPRLPDRPKVPVQVVQATLIEMKPRAPQVVPPEPERKPPPPPPPPPRDDERKKQLEKERAEAERRKQAAEEKRRAEKRRQQAEKKKEEDERRKKEAEERRREEARKRAEEERLAEERRRREEEQRREEQRERVQDFLREQARRQEIERQQAQEALIAVQSYQSAIQQHVARFWSRPPSARNDMQVTLQIQLVPGGDVIDVVVIESSGNGAFDRSAVNAVQRAGRLPVPDDPRLFDKSFRRFKMRFRPEDLNW